MKEMQVIRKLLRLTEHLAREVWGGNKGGWEV